MRVFYDNNAEITEVTNLVKRIDQTNLVFSYEAGQFMYLLSDLPFNHIYLSLGSVVNAVSATIKIEYYSSNGWVEVVNINDLTNNIAKSGHIEFTPNRDLSWKMGSTNSSGDKIDGLESISVYDVYAVRISFNQTLTEDVQINYIGHCFSDDIDLYSEFPIFNDADFLNAFKSGKTGWEEQSIKAADIIIKDLKSKNVICGDGQILDRYLFTNASIQKTAEIIFSSFGSDYVNQKIDARKEYSARMDMKIFKEDKNNNAIPDAVEKVQASGWLLR